MVPVAATAVATAVTFGVATAVATARGTVECLTDAAAPDCTTTRAAAGALGLAGTAVATTRAGAGVPAGLADAVATATARAGADAVVATEEHDAVGTATATALAGALTVACAVGAVAVTTTFGWATAVAVADVGRTATAGAARDAVAVATATGFAVAVALATATGRLSAMTCCSLNTCNNSQETCTEGPGLCHDTIRMASGAAHEAGGSPSASGALGAAGTSVGAPAPTVDVKLTRRCDGGRSSVQQPCTKRSRKNLRVSVRRHRPVARPDSLLHADAMDLDVDELYCGVDDMERQQLKLLWWLHDLVPGLLCRSFFRYLSRLAVPLTVEWVDLLVVTTGILADVVMITIDDSSAASASPHSAHRSLHHGDYGAETPPA